MTIYDALRKDHDIQRSLLDQLINTSGDSDERRRLFDQTKQELTRHAAAEERHFYIPLFEDDLTQEKSRHSVAEHHEIDELIEKLETTDFSSPGWLTIAKTLAEQVTHHLDEEEREVFQLSGKVLTDNQKTSMAKAYSQEMAAR